MPPRRARPRLDEPRLTVQETAERLGVSRDTVLRYIANGDLVALDLASSTDGGKRNLRVLEKEIENFLFRRGVK